MAGGSIVAGVVMAAGDGRTAVLPSVTWRAGASIAVFLFLTRATILARKGLAMTTSGVGVFTVLPKEALHTLAEIRVHQIYAFCTIQAGVGGAVVNLLLTIESCISHWTLTEVASLRVITAAATIKTRTIGTSVGTHLAVVAIKTRWAGAIVAVFIVSAAASVATRVSRAFIDLDLTAGTSEARQTGASVAPLTSVGTSRSIQARLVMSTVVKILIAEKSTPSFLAVALPWLLAGPMQTARITDTVITITATETHTALALSRFIAEAMFFITPRQTDWFSAVLALPTSVADNFSTLATGEVSKGIVSRSAED